MKKGITFRIKPSTEQKELLNKHFGCSRYVWNVALAERIKQYELNKLNSSYLKDCAKLTLMKRDNPWMYEVSSGSQQRSLKNLDDAYRAFFKKRSGFPAFKSKHGKQSFSVSAREVRVKGKRICLPKFCEGIKFNRALPDFERVTSVSITRKPSGKYYASILVDFSPCALPSNGASIGLDLGITDFAVLSNGKRLKNERHTVRNAAALKRAQHHLSRKKKGSKRSAKQKIKVAIIHEKIANSRKWTLHQHSSYVVRNFDYIAIEDLAVKNLAKHPTLAKHVLDAGWGEFTRQLEYKSQWYGRELVKVDRFFPSSKSCNACGFINQNLTLADRSWQCVCGVTHDRDLNAAKNILAEAMKLSGRISPNTGMEAA